METPHHLKQTKDQIHKMQLNPLIVVTPIYNSILELIHLTIDNLRPILNVLSIGILAFLVASSLGYYQYTLWCLKWVILGILSSVGFGFGMHTFVLFLAPHIIAVTVASQTCNTLSFPEPPYPDKIICPENYYQGHDVTFFQILLKVWPESFMWGLGTAIGELPPYLTARLKYRGKAGEDAELKLNAVERWIISLIKTIGFFGIFLFAAIPNPLFDFAGIASGMAQIPFTTFFGATMIDSLIKGIEVKLGELIPSLIDLNLQEFVEHQQKSFLTKQAEDSQPTFMLSYLFNWLIKLIIIIFAVSVIRELDKQYRGRKLKHD